MIPKKTYILKLSDKGFKAAIINIFKVLKQNLITMNIWGNMSSKAETMKNKGYSVKTQLNNISKIKQINRDFTIYKRGKNEEN